MAGYKAKYERIVEHIRGINHELNALAPCASSVVRSGIWAVRYALKEVEEALHGLLKAFEILKNGGKNKGKEKSSG